MAFPPISTLPAAPQRTDDPDTFTSKADAFVAALPTMVTELNDAGDYIDTKTISVGNDFQGNYDAATTYSTGQSVLYTDAAYYISLVDNNTGNAPDTSTTEWAVIGGGGAGGRTIGELQYFSGAETVDYPEDKWLLCDGSVLLKSAYPDLSSTVGSIINGVTTSTTYNNTLGNAINFAVDYSGTGNFKVWQSSGSVEYTTTDFETYTTSTGYGGNGISYRMAERNANRGGSQWVMNVNGSTAYVSSDGGETTSAVNIGITQANNGNFDYGDTPDVWVTVSGNTFYYQTGTLGQGWNNYTISTGSGDAFGNQPYQVRYTGYNNYWVGTSYFMDINRTSNITSSGGWDHSNGITSGSSGGFFPILAILKSAGIVIVGEPDTGVVYRSTDGAQNFSQTTTFASGGIRAMFEPIGTDGEVFAQDTAYVLYKTTDGSTWTNLGKLPVAITGITKSGSSTYYVYGAQNAIIETTDNFATSSFKEGFNGQHNSKYNSIIYNGTDYINAAQGGGLTRISPDFTTIEPVISNLSIANYCIEYDGTTYVVGGDDGKVATSTNLTTWSTAQTPSSTIISCVKKLNGTWYIGDYGGGVWTTTNFLTFTNVANVGNFVSDLAYGDGVGYVIWADSNSTHFSSDGTNFSSVGGMNISDAYMCIWDGNQFLATARGYNPYPGFIYTSSDGQSWSAALTQSADPKPLNISYSNGVYFVGATSGGSFLSTDGSNFTDLKTSLGGGLSSYYVASDDTTGFILTNYYPVQIPFYTYNTTTHFALPNQGSANVASGTTNLFIRAEA